MRKVVRLTESDLVRIVKRVVKESEDEGDRRLYNDISVEDYISAKMESDGDYIDTIRILIKKLYPEVQDNILYRITQDIDEDEINQDLNNEMSELMDKFNRERISWTEQQTYVNKLKRDYFKKYISNLLKNNRLF